MIRTLSSPNPMVRASAAYVLGALKAEAAREGLTRALDDRVPMVRQNAAAALARPEK